MLSGEKTFFIVVSLTVGDLNPRSTALKVSTALGTIRDIILHIEVEGDKLTIIMLNSGTG
jgi:hypothetical protein